MTRPAGRHAVIHPNGADTGHRFSSVHHPIDLEMDFDSVPGLCERFGLTFPDL